jgi:hypothetical protein
MKHAPVLLALVCGVAASGAARSQTAPENIRVCSQLADPGERLRCYDAQLPPSPPAPAAASTAPAPAPAAAVPAPAPAAAATPPPAAKFGQEDLPQTARPKKTEAEQVLLSNITGIREAGPNIYYISLANGQVWRQEGNHVTMFFRTGYDVRIERGWLGDYRFSTVQTGTKNWVTVTRIQ